MVHVPQANTVHLEGSTHKRFPFPPNGAMGFAAVSPRKSGRIPVAEGGRYYQNVLVRVVEQALGQQTGREERLFTVQRLDRGQPWPLASPLPPPPGASVKSTLVFSDHNKRTSAFYYYYSFIIFNFLIFFLDPLPTPSPFIAAISLEACRYAADLYLVHPHTTWSAMPLFTGEP